MVSKMGKTKTQIAERRARRLENAHLDNLIGRIAFWPTFAEALDRTFQQSSKVTWGRAWVIDGLYRLGELELAQRLTLWAICVHVGDHISLSWLQEAGRGEFIKRWYLDEALSEEEALACPTHSKHYTWEQVIGRHDKVYAWIERERRHPTYKNHPLCQPTITTSTTNK